MCKDCGFICDVWLQQKGLPHVENSNEVINDQGETNAKARQNLAIQLTSTCST